MALKMEGLFVIVLFLVYMTTAVAQKMAVNNTIVAILGQPVKLPCVYNTDISLNKNLMRIYWQYMDGKETKAMKMYNKGVMEKEITHFDKMYQDRVKITDEELQKGDFSLILDAVEVSDHRTYQTVFMYKDKVLLECTNQVDVGAEFHKPNISVKSCVKSAEKMEEVEVTCHTWGGLPKPSIHWSSNNHLVHEKVVSEIKQSSQNESFFVWSHLTVNASVGQKYTCSIFNPTLGTTQENSITVHLCSTPDQFPTATVLTTAVIIVVFIAGLVLYFFWQNKNGNRPEGRATAPGYDVEIQKLQGNCNYENHTDSKIV